MSTSYGARNCSNGGQLPGQGKQSVSTKLRRFSVERGIERSLWLVAPAFVFIVVMFIYPVLYGIMVSFEPQRFSGVFGNYVAFFTDYYLCSTIWNTFRIAVPVAFICLAAAIPLALLLRRKSKGQRVISTILVIPMTFGAVLVAIGLLTYLGPKGWFNRTLEVVGLISEPLPLIHNFWGVIIAQTITEFPLAFLLSLAYVSGISPSMEDAARTLGASSWQRLTRVTLPLLAPGLAITFSLIFVEAFSVFPTATLVGNSSGDSHVVAVAAANSAFQKYDYSMASAISVITAICEFSVVAVIFGLRSRLYTGSTAGGKG